MFKSRFADLCEEGVISEEDAGKFTNFVGMTNHPTFSLFILAKAGKLAHLEHDEGYQATLRVLSAFGMDDVTFTQHTSMPVEEQFWQQFDGMNQLTEAGMRKELPNFISDPSNLAKVSALLEEGVNPDDALPHEETRQIA